MHASAALRRYLMKSLWAYHPTAKHRCLERKPRTPGAGTYTALAWKHLQTAKTAKSPETYVYPPLSAVPQRYVWYSASSATWPVTRRMLRLGFHELIQQLALGIVGVPLHDTYQIPKLNDDSIGVLPLPLHARHTRYRLCRGGACLPHTLWRSCGSWRWRGIAGGFGGRGRPLGRRELRAIAVFTTALPFGSFASALRGIAVGSRSRRSFFGGCSGGSRSASPLVPLL